MQRSSDFWTVVLLVLTAAGTPSRACTIVYPSYTAGPDFQVKVTDGSHPVEGLQVRLYRSGVAKILAVTDSNGVAQFHKVGPGSYELSAGPDAGIADGAGIEVKLAESSETTIPLQWPSRTPVLAGSLRGTLHLTEVPGQHRVDRSIELLDAFSGRSLRISRLGGDGAFDFSDVARGLYLLRLRPSGGDIAVRFEPGVSTVPLELDVGWTSCGLYYVDQNHCPHPDLHLEHLTGRVVDASEGAIADAEILVLGAAGQVVQRTQSDNSGNIAGLHLTAGTYRLEVRSPGFSSFRATLTVDPAGSRSPLKLQLGVMGMCSTAKTD